MTAEFWEYDARLGRRWNIDPVVYSWQSPYACFNNNPIVFSDPFGLEGQIEKDPPKGEKGSSKYDYERGLHEFVRSPTSYADGNHSFWDYSKRFVGGALKGVGGTLQFVAYFFAISENNSFIVSGKGLFQLAKTGVTGLNWLAAKAGLWKEPDWSIDHRKGIVDAFNNTDFTDPELYGELVGSMVGGGTILKGLNKFSKLSKLATVKRFNTLASAEEKLKYYENFGSETLDDFARMAPEVASGGMNLIPEGNLVNHLFKGAGKLADNPANRTLIQYIANTKPLGVDAFGKSWYMGLDGEGKSIYVYTQNGVVKGAGYATMTAEEMILKYGLK